MPRWLVRRWRLLMNVLNNPEFIKKLPSLADEYRINNNLPTANCFKAFREFDIPGDCAPAIWVLLEQPKLIDKPQKLIRHIKPPIEYVSYKAKQRGLADDPNEAFKYWEQKRQELKAKGSDFIEEFDGIFLEIASYTTKEELMGFVDEYFDIHLKPLLQQGEGYFTPEELRKGRIRKAKKLPVLMQTMRKDGKTALEIMRELGLGRETSSINRTIANYKKKREKS